MLLLLLLLLPRKEKGQEGRDCLLFLLFLPSFSFLLSPFPNIRLCFPCEVL
jgi:hypothetical protein